MLLAVLLALTSCHVTFALTTAERTALTALGQVTVTDVGGDIQLTSTGLPNHATPNVAGNPNTARAQNYVVLVPNSPVYSATNEGCLPMGPVGMAITGATFYNPLTAESTDAVIEETFDSCMGHSDNNGRYHYHQGVAPACALAFSTADALVGIAYDGFPIYGPIIAGGVTLTSDSKLLDECHGRLVNGLYRYHITSDCPYIMGCFRGTHSGGTMGCQVTKAFIYDKDSICAGDRVVSSVLVLMVTLVGILL